MKLAYGSNQTFVDSQSTTVTAYYSQETAPNNQDTSNEPTEQCEPKTSLIILKNGQQFTLYEDSSAVTMDSRSLSEKVNTLLPLDVDAGETDDEALDKGTRLCY